LAALSRHGHFNHKWCYSSLDYLRLGWPLVVITFIVVLATAHIFWHV
jgi:hypothetical protein